MARSGQKRSRPQPTTEDQEQFAELRRRLEHLVGASGRSAAEISAALGRNASYISQITTGKQKSINVFDLVPLSIQLDCDVRYLLLDINTPRPRSWPAAPTAPEPASSLKFGGVCETGVWRPSSLPAVERQSNAILAPHFPFPGEQLRFEARGDAAASAHIRDGMAVIGLGFRDFVKHVRPLTTGMLVVLRRERIASGEVELSIRRATVGKSIILASPDNEDVLKEIDMSRVPREETAEIVAVVSAGIEFFI